MRKTNKKLYLKGITKIHVIFLTTFFLISFLLGRLSNAVLFPTTTNAQQVSPQILAHKDINKSFSFPVEDQNNNVITQLTYILQSADLMNQIVVKGQLATAIKGKTFLVINLRLDNSSDKSVIVNTRDYIRLTTNKSNELLAPEVYNDPVEIQPASTKLTRVGIPINTSDKNLVLHIGEISGEKTDIPLSF